jgi:hypothetical protein
MSPLCSLKAIKAGQHPLVGRLTSPLLHLVSTWAKLIKKLRS